MPKGDYLTKPMFGAPRDDVERAARDWLEVHVGEYGEDVMRSLADLIKSELKRNRAISGPPRPTSPPDHTPVA